MIPQVEDFNKKMNGSDIERERILLELENLEKKAKVVQAESEVNFLKSPNVWIYLTGLFFGLSSICALVASNVEEKRPKIHEDSLKLSYGFMYTGFASIVFIAVTVL